MSARIRSAAAAVRAWLISPVTMVVMLLVAGAMAVWLIVDPPREAAGPPATVTTAKVGGFCTRIVTGSDGSVWALAPGAVDGELRSVDAATVDRTECQPSTDGGVPTRPR
jgi:hypothetical protein